jgi:hypothetical protein
MKPPVWGGQGPYKGRRATDERIKGYIKQIYVDVISVDSV